MIVCAVPSFAADTAYGELVANGDMEFSETSMDSWTGYSMGVGKTGYVAHGGEVSTKFTRTESKNSILIQKGEIIGGKDVKISSWIYTEETGKTAGWRVDFRDANEQTLKTEFMMFPVTKGKWTEISTTLPSPEGAVFFQIQLRNGEAGTLCFDDVSMKGEATLMRIEEVEGINKKGIEVLRHSQELYNANVAKG